MKTLLAILLLFVASAGFAEPADRAAEELDVREATYRYLFGSNASGQRQDAKVYCLSVRIGDKDRDPDDAFIRRFAGHQPPVKQASACTAPAGEGVIDKKTGERGLIFNTGTIRWVSGTEVEVSGGYYEAGLSASGNLYSLQKVEGRWRVVKDRMEWISWLPPGRVESGTRWMA